MNLLSLLKVERGAKASHAPLWNMFLLYNSATKEYPSDAATRKSTYCVDPRKLTQTLRLQRAQCRSYV